MNLSNSLESLFRPTVATALLTLSRLGPMSGRQVARVTGAASASVTRTALLELVSIGLVAATARPHAVEYAVNEDHLLWPAVKRARDIRSELDDEINRLAKKHAAAGTSVLLYGSTARFSSTADSDVDLLVVHPDHTTLGERDAFSELLAGRVEAWTGNRAEIYDVTDAQLAELVGNGDPMVESWRHEAVLVAGAKPATLERGAR
ncbi:nucleotidyltransferase domain-containing protein [uncultured Amnibacterium sp.]|uniref:nucleotidyltransferase domain-containing protein n=1 Tax=uncultured Amnibacterium sp. TaxID=1631851 RepID=UPI0035CC7A0E